MTNGVADDSGTCIRPTLTAWRRDRARSTCRGVALGASALLSVAFILPARAQPAASSSAAASAPGPAPPPPPSASAAAAPVTPPPPAIADLRRRAERIRSLLAGELDPGIRPAELFDVPLDDEEAIAVEARRLEALVASITARRARAEAAGRQGEARGADGDEGGGPASAPAEDEGPVPDGLSPRWEARLELDRARLAFLSLPPARRTTLLAEHAARRSSSEAKLDEAMERAATAEADRDRALEEARAARTEAARLVAEETARLLGVAKAQAEFEARLTRERQALATSQEELLRQQRLLRELVERATPPRPEEADRLYDELDRDLVATRTRLAGALATLETRRTTVPTAGEDRLVSMPEDVDASGARDIRAAVLRRAESLAREELALHEELASRLHDQTEALNRARLELVPLLSPQKRDALHGIGAVGRDQARGEVRQVTLVLRRHAIALVSWVEQVRAAPSARGVVGWDELGALVRVLPALLLFVLLRRHTGPLLEGIRDRARAEKKALLGTSWVETAASFLLRIRGPAQWLVLLILVGWLLPEEIVHLLEVELLFTVARWSVGGALVVRAIDALARPDRRGGGEAIVDRLRWRSLVLGGRLVVAFGLVLGVTERLVGRGTVHAWTLQVAWLAALPVVLVVIRWWRPVIFRRFARGKKQGALARWIADHRRGPWSPIATAIALAQLLVAAAVRAARLFVGSKESGRRVLAYLVRRDLSRNREPLPDLAPLPASIRASLGPERQVLPRGPVLAARSALLARIRARTGGVVAVVGERGLGKSTLLDALHRAVPRSVATVGGGGPDALRAELTKAAGLADGAPLEEVAAALAGSANVVLIDDATHLVRPGRAGLAALDAVVAAARRHAGHTTWILAFDAVVWPLVRVARGDRPLFDEVITMRRWSEIEIGELIETRTRSAGVVPSFERLLGTPPVTDAEARAGAVARMRASYARLVWDYALGNPAVALEAWCSSLRCSDERGILVELFSPPPLAPLEGLSDHALFALRAVLQMEPASLDDVVSATRLTPAAVESTLRFAVAHGFLEVEDGRHRVTWAWYRPLTSFLERRHLIHIHE